MILQEEIHSNVCFISRETKNELNSSEKNTHAAGVIKTLASETEADEID